jgi:hypothetical protein
LVTSKPCLYVQESKRILLWLHQKLVTLYLFLLLIDHEFLQGSKTYSRNRTKLQIF